MPNYRRLFVPGGTYAFTVCLADRRADTLVRYIHDFRAAYVDMAERRPVETIAVCILPNHFHVIWALPEDDFDFPIRFNHLKGGFTRRLPEALKSDGGKRERGIWQRRYWEHLIRDERDLVAHIDYVHWNPVKHGYVTDPADWPHSSWHRYKHDWNREYRPHSLNSEKCRALAHHKSNKYRVWQPEARSTFLPLEVLLPSDQRGSGTQHGSGKTRKRTKYVREEAVAISSGAGHNLSAVIANLKKHTQEAVTDLEFEGEDSQTTGKIRSSESNLSPNARRVTAPVFQMGSD